jgi:hypothetical protein
LVIWIERNLAKDIELSVFSTKESLMLDNEAFSKRSLPKGSSVAAFFAEPDFSKLPSGCSTGHKLVGTVAYESGDPSLPGSGKRPGGFPIRYGDLCFFERVCVRWYKSLTCFIFASIKLSRTAETNEGGDN